MTATAPQDKLAVARALAAAFTKAGAGAADAADAARQVVNNAARMRATGNYSPQPVPAVVSRSADPASPEDDEGWDELDVDGLEADAEALAATAGMEPEVSRFNPYHAPPGPGGGEFATAAGGQAGAAKTAAAEKQKLHERAKALREQAAKLSARLTGLLKQLKAEAAAHRAAVAAAKRAAKSTASQAATHRKAKAATKRQAAGAKHAANAAKHPKAAQAARKAAASVHTRKARTHAARVSALHNRIAGLRGRIKDLRQRAAALDAKAAKL